MPTTSTRRQRMLSTLRPFYDFRGLSLLALCAVIGLVTDPAATLGLAGYLAYVIGMAGAAIMLAKIVMPYLDVSEHAASALNEGNVAGAWWCWRAPCSSSASWSASWPGGSDGRRFRVAGPSPAGPALSAHAL